MLKKYSGSLHRMAARSMVRILGLMLIRRSHFFDEDQQQEKNWYIPFHGIAFYYTLSYTMQFKCQILYSLNIMNVNKSQL